MRQTRQYNSRHVRRHGFTLIEIMLALTLFLVLLGVIFVPLNQAFQTFNSGRTSVALQAAADSTVKSIATELRAAVAVFPNDDLPGVTDKSPYSLVPGTSLPPYYEVDPSALPSNPCAAARVNNPSRIDFILPARAADGAIDSSVSPQRYVVTYFPRRLNPADLYDNFTNPVYLYRAQMPYKRDNGTTVSSVNIGNTRFAPSGCNSEWLQQSPATSQVKPASPTTLREPLITDANYAKDVDSVPGGLTVVNPRDMAVNLRLADLPGDSTRWQLQPDVNFTCEDMDGNGVIDRVTISLTLVQYESEDSDGTAKGQRVTATQVVNLPNTRLGV